MVFIMNMLGTVCMIIDENGNTHKTAKIGTISQYNMDMFFLKYIKVGDPKSYYDNHLKHDNHLRMSYLSRPTIFNKCRSTLIAKLQENLNGLREQLQIVAGLGDNCKMFRISSELLPLFDHPTYRFLYDDTVMRIVELGLSMCKTIIDNHGIVIATHPDHFVVLNSDKQHTRLNAIDSLYYHKFFMERLTTAEKSCINIHVTGKLSNIPEFESGDYSDLIPWLSFENDDTNHRAGVLETLDMCEKYGVKFLYDLHHDLCENWGECRYFDVPEVRERILATWRGATPIFHTSQSRNHHLLLAPYPDVTPKILSPHSQYIDDPATIEYTAMLNRIGHVEVEAKGKQWAVLRLAAAIK